MSSDSMGDSIIEFFKDDNMDYVEDHQTRMKEYSRALNKVNG
jgi:hypothetical protein